MTVDPTTFKEKGSRLWKPEAILHAAGPAETVTHMDRVFFVDFFDTIVFRHVHPFQLLDRWAYVLKRTYHLEQSCEEIVSLRRRLFSESAQKHGEVVFRDVIQALHTELLPTSPVSFEAFYRYCEELEISLECGCQYPNQRLLKKLSAYRENGAKIYIVSDFHLGKAALSRFLVKNNISLSLFDDIFVSADHLARKSSGGLYDLVMDTLGFTPSEITMIGDNPRSDCAVPREKGIHCRLRRRLFHKAVLYVQRKTDFSYSEHIAKTAAKDCYRSGLPYSEYSCLFFSFTQRLAEQLAGRKVFFLSREGYFLKQLYDQYIYLHTGDASASHSEYFLCSRRSITSIQREKFTQDLFSQLPLRFLLVTAGFTEEEIAALAKELPLSEDELNAAGDETLLLKLKPILLSHVDSNRQAFLRYAASKGIASGDALVDIGWIGSMQKGIEDALQIKLKGYYLGTAETNPGIDRTGLLFCPEMGPTYPIMRANAQFHEQLCSAPHGSPLTYHLSPDGEVDVPLVWEDAERELYTQKICQHQASMTEICNGLTAWVDGAAYTDKDHLNIVMRSGLFAGKERSAFAKSLDAGFVQNFMQTTAQTKYSAKSVKHVKISADIFTKPEAYYRYAVKCERFLFQKPLLHGLYYIAAALYTLYVKMVLRGKSKS